MRRHPSETAADALRIRDWTWVEEQRRANDPRGTSAVSRTGTRGTKGKIFRWDDYGWTDRLVPDGSRSKKKLYRRADKLRAELLGSAPAAEGDFL